MSNNNSLSKKKEKIRDALAEILNECQNTFAVHPNNAKRAVKLFQMDKDIFQSEFFNYINRVLTVYQREMAVERVVQFIITVTLKLSSIKWKQKEDVEGDASPAKSKKNTKNTKNTKNAKKGKKVPKKRGKPSESDSDEDLSGEDLSGEGEDDDDEEEKSTESSDFPIAILKYLLEITGSKEKAVRFRSCQLIAGLISKLDIEYGCW
jgi:hypothetical protein